MDNWFSNILQIVSYLFVGYFCYLVGNVRGYKEGVDDVAKEIRKRK